MTSLLIGFPGVFADAKYLECTREPDSFLSIYNISRGFRGSYFKTNAKAGTIRFEADLISPNQSIEFIAIARADLLLEPGGTVEVRLRSAAGQNGLIVSANNVYVNVDLGAETLMGPKGRDFITPLSPAGGANRWHALLFNTNVNQFFRFSKCYAGPWFDFGSEPVNYSCQVSPNTSYFKADDGTGYADNADDSRFQGFLEWGGVSDAVAEDFQARSQEMPLSSAFLYAAEHTKVLAGNTVLHVEFVSTTVTKVWNNFNSVRVEYREMLG